MGGGGAKEKIGQEVHVAVILWKKKLQLVFIIKILKKKPFLPRKASRGGKEGLNPGVRLPRQHGK